MPETRKVTGDALGLPGYVGVEAISTGQAVVWKARQESTGHFVAVKVVPCYTPADRSRFDREKHALERLIHVPNIVTLIDSGERPRDGAPWLVFPWYDQTLDDLAGTMPWREVARIGIGICDGLRAVDQVNVVHRDLKPGNVLIYEDPRHRRTPLLTDFGIAKVSDRATTIPDGTRGSFPYIAPERFTDVEFTGNELSEVYALSGTLFTVLTGTVPLSSPHNFNQLSNEQLMFLTLNDPAPPLPEGRAPGLFADLLAQGLAKQPKDRPPLDEFQATLERIANLPLGAVPDPTAAGDAPKPSKPVPSPEPQQEPRRRGLAKSVALIGAVSLIIVALMFGAHQISENAKSDEQTGQASSSTTTTASASDPALAAPVSEAPPVTLSQVERIEAARNTPYRAVVADDPDSHLALFKGDEPGEICGVGQTASPVTRLGTWHEKNMLAAYDVYSTENLLNTSAVDYPNGGLSSLFYDLRESDLVHRVIFQTVTDGTVNRTIVEIGDVAVDNLPDYATMQALQPGDYPDLEPYYAPAA